MKLNEETVKGLPVPETGNRVTYFAGATIQGKKAPRGFGVRVTAAGARAFVLNYRLRGREYRYTIGAWPDWSALKAVGTARDLRQSVDRGENPLAARTPPPELRASRTSWTISLPAMFAVKTVRYGVPTTLRVPSTDWLNRTSAS